MLTARRRAVRDWLAQEGKPAGVAESWCDAWETEATARGLLPQSFDYWKDAGPWIAERLTLGRPPA
jgi:hypothetical protein